MKESRGSYLMRLCYSTRVGCRSTKTRCYSQAAFAQSYGLPYPLLSDFPHGRTVLSYGVEYREGDASRLFARPSFFLVDKEGFVRGYWGQRPWNVDDVLPPDPLVSSQPMLQMARAIVR